MADNQVRKWPAGGPDRSHCVAVPISPEERTMPVQQQTFSMDRVPTPLGDMLVVTDTQQRLRALDWHDYEERMQRLLFRQYRRSGIQLTRGKTPAHMREAIESYLHGELTAIDAIEVATAGTAFQRSVWTALRDIPVGTTVTYGGLAQKLGCPKAVRAVGLANGANPIGVVVPCHRVIGSDGSLTGYGGGLERKRWLLEHEGATFGRKAGRQLSLNVEGSDPLRA
jgi:methylated-DNA-[protein]-cysteine S-methyltransferase